MAAFATIAVLCCVAARPSDRSIRLEEQIRDRGLDPAAVIIPFELDDEMRKWVREEMNVGGDPQQRLGQLLRAILHRNGNELTYERGYMATAREVWRTNRANCLSFAHLYVGLARESGLRVYYLRVADLQNFEKDGDLVVASEHITAAYGPPTERRILEFTDRPVKKYYETEPISDLTAIALHYSNLGAQQIRESRFQEAELLLQTAVRLDPELADGWLNLGVSLRRLNHVAEAETSFRRALEANARLVPAYNNLAALLERDGRTEEARALLDLTDRRGNRNPFSYIELGDLAFREKRLDQAERFYRRALSFDSEQAESLAALGQCALASGRRREAERWFIRADAADPGNPRTLELARRLFGPVPIGRASAD
jgi:Flp pilus assembly protein TadD